MVRLVRFVCVALLLLAGDRHGRSAEDGAAAIDRWNAAYNANDLDALVKAYAPDAILQGTSEAADQCRDGGDSASTLGTLPKGGSNSIQERRMFVINDTTVLGSVSTRSKAGQRRFSFLVVKRGNDWLIQHHHSSAIPKGRD